MIDFRYLIATEPESPDKEQLGEHPAIMRLMELSHELWDDGLDQAAQTIESSCKELSAVIGQPGEQRCRAQYDPPSFGEPGYSKYNGPAAAPDAAEMVRQLKTADRTQRIANCHDEQTLYGDAAAMIEKLGQGWIPMSSNDPTRQVAWVDRQTRHIKMTTSEGIFMLHLPPPPERP